MQNTTVSSKSVRQTIKIGQIIGTNLKGGELIVLKSDLGSGKTTFIKGLAKGAGCLELVSSPSFTICNEYQAKNFKIYHFDFYRLNDPGISQLELAEVINGQDVVAIEWPEAIENTLPNKQVIITITPNADNERLFNIQYSKELKYLLKGTNDYFVY